MMNYIVSLKSMVVVLLSWLLLLLLWNDELVLFPKCESFVLWNHHRTDPSYKNKKSNDVVTRFSNTVLKGIRTSSSSFTRVNYHRLDAMTQQQQEQEQQEQQEQSKKITISSNSLLAQLASMTVLSIDSGDLDIISSFADTGYITDATTNPLFVSQAGCRTDDNDNNNNDSSSSSKIYSAMVNDAVQYAVEEQKKRRMTTTTTTTTKSNTESMMKPKEYIVGLSMDRLAVNLGAAIAKIVPGFVSTEVDPRLSFDRDATVERALRILRLYEELGVPRERILIKIAATWEGIQATKILQQQHNNVRCNLTLIFSVVQAIACAEAKAHLISPFPGRILDWHNQNKKRTEPLSSPEYDEGVLACRDMYNYFKIHNYDTICMPASWRPSRGPGFELDEILALAGTDRMTIPAPLLHRLATLEGPDQSQQPLARRLSPELAQSMAQQYPRLSSNDMSEQEFRYRLNMDGCGTDKLAEGLRAFIGETEKLQAVMTRKVEQALND